MFADWILVCRHKATCRRLCVDDRFEAERPHSPFMLQKMGLVQLKVTCPSSGGFPHEHENTLPPVDPGEKDTCLSIQEMLLIPFAVLVAFCEFSISSMFRVPSVYCSVLANPLLILIFCMSAIAFFDHVPKAFRWPVRIAFAFGLVAIVWIFLRTLLRNWQKNRRSVVFPLLALLIYYPLFEGACWVFHRAVMRADATYVSSLGLDLSKDNRNSITTLLSGTASFYQIDSATGWSIRPGSRSGELYTSNGDGFRSKKEFAITAPPNITRIACCGDSYTFCSEVADDDSWPQHLQNKLGNSFEILNFGVAGTGLAQSYVRYQDKVKKYHPDIVLIGYMSENLKRTLNVFRPFLLNSSGFPFAKPYATLDSNGKVEVRPPFLTSNDDYQRLLDHPREVLAKMAPLDYWFVNSQKSGAVSGLTSVRVWHYMKARTNLANNFAAIVNRNPPRDDLDDAYEAGSFPFRVNELLFQKYAQEVKEHGSRPIIILFPSPQDLRMYNATGGVSYRSLKSQLVKGGLEVIDMLDLFAKEYSRPVPLDRIFLKVHYNGDTNQKVAQFISEAISM
jgi:hypothetical protein